MQRLILESRMLVSGGRCWRLISLGFARRPGYIPEEVSLWVAREKCGTDCDEHRPKAMGHSMSQRPKTGVHWERDWGAGETRGQPGRGLSPLSSYITSFPLPFSLFSLLSLSVFLSSPLPLPLFLSLSFTFSFSLCVFLYSKLFPSLPSLLLSPFSTLTTLVWNHRTWTNKASP